MFGSIHALAQDGRQNYVKKTTITSESTAWVEYNYADGLGRPCQTVRSGYTPSGKDLVECQEYNMAGLVSKVWLPVVASGQSFPLSQGTLEEEAQKQYGDQSPFQSHLYESSPMRRNTQTFGAGGAWRTAHASARTEYLSNGQEEVLSLRIANPAQPNVVSVGYHAPGNLEKVVTYDEHSYDMRSSIDFQRYSYYYEYDIHNRCILKRLPGCEPVEMLYDKADRMIFSQDGNQKRAGKWIYFFYDKYGRTLSTGLCSMPTLPSMDDKVVVVPEDGGVPAGLNLADIDKLQGSYYDDYEFLKGSSPRLAFVPKEGYDLDIVHSDSMMTTCGLLTGKTSKVLGGSNEVLKTAYYYDVKGRMVQKRSDNVLGGFDFEYYALDYYTGQPIRKYMEHILADTVAFTEKYEYAYDHAGRLVATYHTLNDGERKLLSANTYDELGRLSRVDEGNVSNLTTTYAYNIRNWITAISNGVCCQKMYYNEKRDKVNSVPQWNGNLSSYSWNSKSYDYSYDANDWLKSAYSTEMDGGKTVEGLYDTSYSYDSMGNLLSIQRNGVNTDTGENGLRDDVVLEYDGNQLKSVSNSGYKDSSYDMQVSTGIESYGNDLVYDANGNVVKDKSKGIVSIKYNVLNLPEEIYSKNADCRYVYDADGNKLECYYNIKPIASVPSSKDMDKVQLSGISFLKWLFHYVYVDDYVCQVNMLDNSLQVLRLNLPNGYVSNPISKDCAYKFYVKDHLGNNRYVVDGNGKVTQTNNYYPFGGTYGDEENESSQAWRFGGKELDRNFDLYDFLARWYDPTLGRFTTVDPKAEDYPWLSPYVYCANNPINATDPTGESIYFLFYTHNNTRIGTDGDQEFFNAAWTRKMDIEKGRYFDKNRDIVLLLPFEDLSELKGIVERNISKYSRHYGKTKEVGFWSHAGYDGPIGTRYSDADNIIGDRQLSINGWSEINFNWSDNASIGFYGCNTANDDRGMSFAQKISEKMPGINVFGQPGGSYFSASNSRAEKVGRKAYLRTYLISTSKRPYFWWLDSGVLRMRYFKNGKQFR